MESELDMGNAINSCPFCGGRAKVTAREYKFGGWNGWGESRRKYQVRVMCNRCHAYGPCINTGWVKTTWKNWKLGYRVALEDVAPFEWAEKTAVEKWNEPGRAMMEAWLNW